MAANTSPIFPIAPSVGIANLSAIAAIGPARSVIAGTVGLVQLTPVSTNGKRIDAITATAAGNTAAGAVDIWIYNGTSSFYFTSLDVIAVASSTTTDPFTLTKNFTNLVLPPSYQLFVSQTVAQTMIVFAFGGDY